MKVLVLAQDEVLRLFSTRRGIISIVGYCLIWIGVLIYGIMPAAQFINGAVDSGLAEILLPKVGMQALRLWPTPELAVYWMFSLTLLPFLTLLNSADQTASDRVRGTLRYLVMRASRLEIFFGRFLGQLFIALCVVLVSYASVVIVVVLNSADQLPQALSRSPVIVVNMMLVLAPFIALMAMVSVIAKSARQATLFALIIWILGSLIVGYLGSKFPDITLLSWILPGSQIKNLFLLAEWDTLKFASIPLIHTLVLLAIGALLMRQRDL